jgi:hypothetical protein
VERGIHRNGEIRRDRALADRVHEAGVIGREHEDARDDLFLGADVRHDRFHVVGRQPVDDRAVALAPGQAQHSLAQRGDEDRRLLGNRDPETKAAHAERLVLLVDFLAGQCFA